jgi:hypothetical protein
MGTPVLPRLEAHKVILEDYRQLRSQEWIAALTTTQGNITRAAKIMDPPMSRQRATVFTKELGLRDFALRLRVAAGMKNGRGRPR